jgi:PQQ-like domain
MVTEINDRKQGLWLHWILLVFIFIFVEPGFAQSEPDEVQPLWQLSLTAVPGSANAIFYGDTVAYYFQDEQLHVLDVQTGETLWQVDYPLITVRDYTLLPASGEGLIFVPRANTLEALNERTGKQIWSYELSEDLTDIPQNTNNRTGVFYGNGYVFAQTQNTIVGLEAATGSLVWQKDKTKEKKVYLTLQVLSDKVFAANWTDIKEIPVLPHAISSGLTIYSLESGQELWTSRCTSSCIPEILAAGDNTVDLIQSDRRQESFTISRYDLLTGKELQNCSPESGAGNIMFRRYLFPLVLAYSSRKLVTASPWIYADTTQVTNIAPTPNYTSAIDIYRLPDCSQPATPIWSPVETVSKDIDRYFLPTLLYAEIAPFSWVAGPLNESFLFQNEGQLYKVPVPQESFTYLYHNKSDDSVYIEPKFADIDPPPYELIPGIKGKVVKVELLDNLIVALLEDGTLQVINFDSLATVRWTPSFRQQSKVS